MVHGVFALVLQVLIPLKELRLAKSRLAGELCSDQREALVAAIALDQIDTLLSHSHVASLKLIVGSGWERPLSTYVEAGTSTRCELISEHSLSVTGLNPLLSRAIDVIAPKRCLVLHGDLPLLSADDLDRLCIALDQHDVVLCPDKVHGGTNGLAFRSPARPEFAFGANSFKQHRLQVASELHSYTILESPGFSLDIDTPADLNDLMQAVEAGAIIGPRLSRWLDAFAPVKHESVLRTEAFSAPPLGQSLAVS